MLSPSLEDYLEEAYRLYRYKKDIKVRYIAKKLHVSSPSVVKAFTKLHDEKYLIYQKYETIKLTQKGEALGKLLVKRNSMLQEFLKVIGSDCDIEKEAEAMEHYLSSPTIEAIEKLVEFLKVNAYEYAYFLNFHKNNTHKHWSEGIEK